LSRRHWNFADIRDNHLIFLKIFGLCCIKGKIGVLSDSIGAIAFEISSDYRARRPNIFNKSFFQGKESMGENNHTFAEKITQKRFGCLHVFGLRSVNSVPRHQDRIFFERLANLASLFFCGDLEDCAQLGYRLSFRVFNLIIIRHPNLYIFKTASNQSLNPLKLFN